jgi:glyoxylase I family protein
MTRRTQRLLPSAWIVDLNQLDANDGARFDVTRTGIDHLGLTASSRESLEDWATWLDEHDVRRYAIREMPAPVVGAMFDFVDPDGIPFEFSFVESVALPGVEL